MAKNRGRARDSYNAVPPPPQSTPSRGRRRVPSPQSSSRNMYHFGRDRQQNTPRGGGNNRYDDRPPRDDYWNSRDSHPRFAPGTGPPPPPPPPRNNHGEQYNGQRRDGGPRGRRNDRGRGGDRRNNNRGRFVVRQSDRPLLHHQESKEPARELGIDGSQPRFKPLSELTIDDDEDNAEGEDVMITGSQADEGPESYDEEAGPPNKRVAIGDIRVEADRPKWSNPDPYTSMPPPSGMHNAGKKAINLIRKARMSTGRSDLAANDEDFISFEDGDDSDGGVALGSDGGAVRDDAPPPNAPTGPRSMHPLPPKPSFAAPSDPGPPPPPPPGVNMNLTDAGGRAPVSFNMPKPITVATDTRSAPPGAPSFADRLGSSPIDRGPKKRKRPEALILHTPWGKYDNFDGAEDMEKQLHTELYDFYCWARPKDHEHKMRADVVTRLQRVLDSSSFPACEVKSFGSYPAGIYLPTADMDLVAISRQFRDRNLKTLCQDNRSMQGLARSIRSAGIASSNRVIVISKAKVPLVKYVDKITGINVDVSFENMTGLIANGTYAAWKEKYPAMPVLVTFIKQFLAMRGLNEVHTGGIGGFSISCLVVSLLQNWPECNRGQIDPFENLGKTLMYFLDFYGSKFEYTTIGIQFNPPGYFLKADDKREYQRASNPLRLCIVDPNHEGNDISGGSSQIATVLNEFKRAAKKLTERNMSFVDGKADQPEAGLLGPILADDFYAWNEMRDRLAHLHQVVGS